MSTGPMDAIPEGQKLPQRAISRWGSLYGWERSYRKNKAAFMVGRLWVKGLKLYD
ncbi:MAG: hypothetical protein F6J98_23720 [Moorea sp. SIO4G2]|uniref:hypothetical protein n=1 Tax=unclassified Moorena TaxID=2683338 RepID=UPI0013F8EF95|nr:MULTISPECIES: hypothetical protein [unclassified Moorena]NEO16903.1 hypothetical protein [Moorena sp. SIO3E8]NEO63283.1 hypothetical protein [Moorena sp. SIO4G2]NEP27334.1 hypothetical protein [Moorena sp. SIO3I6]NEQ01235.1 hypothetical protein [Moorena sp. SIO3F7]